MEGRPDGDVVGRHDGAEHGSERIDWETIDSRPARPSRPQLFGGSIVGCWLLAAAVDGVVRVVAGDPVSFPLVGQLGTVDWLWGLTLLLLGGTAVWLRGGSDPGGRRVWRQLRTDRAALLSAAYVFATLVVGILGSRVLASPDPNPRFDNQPPVWSSVETSVVTDCVGDVRDGNCYGTWHHPFGTTSAGEDLLTAVVYGMEVSLQVGLIGTLLSLTIATSVALTAAAAGGLVDDGLMRLVDLQLTFPTFFLYLLLAYTIGGNLLLLILIVGCFGWGRMARIIRAEARQRQAAPYVEAARAAGASRSWILRRHLLPNVSNSVITAATVAIPSIILAEAAIAFLGLGDPSTHSWGRLVADGREWIRHAWWLSTIPGVALVLTVLAFTVLGDALRDALDPRDGQP